MYLLTRPLPGRVKHLFLRCNYDLCAYCGAAVEKPGTPPAGFHQSFSTCVVFEYKTFPENRRIQIVFWVFFRFVRESCEGFSRFSHVQRGE